jgi:hypothetical protein
VAEIIPAVGIPQGGEFFSRCGDVVTSTIGDLRHIALSRWIVSVARRAADMFLEDVTPI